MKLNEIGEFGLIDLIKPGTIVDSSSIIAGIGDDAAVILPRPHQLQLMTADMLVEGIHFELNTTSGWQLGYKGMAVNFSDIAAMGGIPRQALVSIAIPPTMAVEFVVDMYEGMKEICREYQVNIVGGDTVASLQGLVFNVTVLGEASPATIVRRSGAQVGDIVAVTGTLGNSS
jgi:thiamin-phosphate kinase